MKERDNKGRKKEKKHKKDKNLVKYPTLRYQVPMTTYLSRFFAYEIKGQLPETVRHINHSCIQNQKLQI